MPDRDNKFVRCDPADPNRCQGSLKGSGGQCPYKAEKKRSDEGVELEEYTQYCPMHTGISINKTRTDEQQKFNYRLGKYQARVERFANSSQVKSLREEIGVTRMLLEEIVLSCKDNTDLIVNSGKIGDLVLKIEKLVVSCHKLELQSGLLLDKTAIINFANTLNEII